MDRSGRGVDRADARVHVLSHEDDPVLVDRDAEGIVEESARRGTAVAREARVAGPGDRRHGAAGREAPDPVPEGPVGDVDRSVLPDRHLRGLEEARAERRPAVAHARRVGRARARDRLDRARGDPADPVVREVRDEETALPVGRERRWSVEEARARRAVVSGEPGGPVERARDGRDRGHRGRGLRIEGERADAVVPGVRDVDELPEDQDAAG